MGDGGGGVGWGEDSGRLLSGDKRGMHVIY